MHNRDREAKLAPREVKLPPMERNSKLFQKICQSAREKNAAAIGIALVHKSAEDDPRNEGIEVKDKSETFTPAGWLAAEGNKEAVRFLQTCFFSRKININSVALGHAFSGDHAEVKRCLDKGADKNVVLYGYALSGRIAQVDALRPLGEYVKSIVQGFAASRYDEYVRREYLLHGARDADIAIGYARAGYVAGVNAAYARAGGAFDFDDIDDIVQGFESAGLCDTPERGHRLLLDIPYKSLRCEVAIALNTLYGDLLLEQIAEDEKEAQSCWSCWGIFMLPRPPANPQVEAKVVPVQQRLLQQLSFPTSVTSFKVK